MKINQFDISKHLKTDKDIQEFLEGVVSTGDTSDFMHALNIAARAKGIAQIAKQVGVTRNSLYKSLSEKGNPRFETISKIVEALGCRLTIIGHH